MDLKYQGCEARCPGVVSVSCLASLTYHIINTSKFEIQNPQICQVFERLYNINTFIHWHIFIIYIILHHRNN